MKDKILKWMKYKWAIGCFVIAALLLAVSGSYAAYTSFNSVKRVVSTGKGNSTMFSSNYLYLVGVDESEYTTRRISPTEEKEGETVTGYTFTVQICNYIFGNEMTYNPKDINYTFTVTVTAKNGGELPAGITGIRINGQAVGEDGTWSISDQKLSKDAAQKKEYPFYVPAELKELVKIQIVAEPDESSQGATDSQKLAAVLTLSSLEPTENWTGEFIDDKSIDVDEYDGFNYEISGNGEGTVTLTWPDKLQISSWFLDDVGAYDITQDGTTGNWSAKFAVGGTTTGADGSEVAAPTAYQFQIYRNSDKDTMSWNEMESQVTVEFEPKTTE